MGIVTQKEKVKGLLRKLGSIEGQIKSLEKENYPKDGPKFSSLELQRSRVAASLTQAQLQPLDEAA